MGVLGLEVGSVDVGTTGVDAGCPVGNGGCSEGGEPDGDVVADLEFCLRSLDTGRVLAGTYALPLLLLMLVCVLATLLRVRGAFEVELIRPSLVATPIVGSMPSANLD